MSTASWQHNLKHNPVEPLLASSDEAVIFFAKKDLLGLSGDVHEIWHEPRAQKIINKQMPDGGWAYPGGNQKIRSAENYNQIETFRNLGYLIEMFGYDKTSPNIARAAEFLLRFQTPQGDIRGILGNQLAPYYTAAMAELLIKAGYADDRRIKKVFDWLSAVRQNDGGWAIPLRTWGKKLDIIAMESPTLEPDKSKPFSHLITGVVLRAYAAHPKYRKSPEAQAAGKLLAARLFKRDKYPDRSAADFWLRFTYPFWFTDLISALDSLSQLGFSKDDPQIQSALNWFIAQQQPSGLWQLKTLKNQGKFNNDLWLSLAICRIFKQL